MMWVMWAVAACGSDNAPDPSPDANRSALRFYEDVAPILAKQCVGCHRAGGIAPFSLVSLADVLAAADAIPLAVESRTMPPYGADNSGSCHTFTQARWLTDREIATVAEWARGDRAAGDPAAAPPLPEPPPPLARVDATAQMPQPYTPDSSLDDDYRCFIVDPGIANDAFLTAFEVRPGEASEVHHILIYQLDSAQAESDAAALDAAAAGPGYTCFGGPGAASSLVGVWAPGMRVASYPAGTGLAVKGSRKFVLQLHYHPHGAPLPDATAVDLTIEPTVTHAASLFLIAATSLTLPPHQPNVAFGSQLTLPGFLGQYDVWGAFPHMHTLGRTLRVDLDRGGTNQCLIDVPRWDFHWQQGYFYDEPPLIAQGGDTVNITCTYDTTSRDRTVRWGEGTDDEMCLSFMYVSPH